MPGSAQALRFHERAKQGYTFEVNHLQVKCHLAKEQSKEFPQQRLLLAAGIPGPLGVRCRRAAFVLDVTTAGVVGGRPMAVRPMRVSRPPREGSPPRRGVPATPVMSAGVVGGTTKTARRCISLSLALWSTSFLLPDRIRIRKVDPENPMRMKSSRIYGCICRSINRSTSTVIKTGRCSRCL